MEGLNDSNNELERPYVAVKRTDSIIEVRICYEGVEQDIYLFYHKRAKCWYNVKKEQVDPKLYYTTLCDTVPTYTERYLYNDTIMEYKYDLENACDKSMESLTFITKNNVIRLNLPENFYINSKLDFDILKQVVVNYRECFPYNDGKINHRNKNYTYYNKIIKDDSTFFYENDGMNNYKLGCLIDVKKYNSLGEFDPHKGISVMSKMKIENLCK